MSSQWTKELLQWIYPLRCPVCGEILSSQEGGAEYGKPITICPECEHRCYRVHSPVCFRCGRPVGQQEELCRNCRGKRFSYLRGYPVWVYNQAMRASIAAFKYHGRREYAAYYGQEFVKSYGAVVKKLHIQALVPVPLYPAKQISRGYNQAELFAEEIGIRMGIRTYTDCLLRVRSTVPQKDLDDRQRYENLQKAFTVRTESRLAVGNIRRVMLVDDIYTTGSTVEMCARALLHAGIEQVYFASVSIGS